MDGRILDYCWFPSLLFIEFDIVSIERRVEVHDWFTLTGNLFTKLNHVRLLVENVQEDLTVGDLEIQVTVCKSCEEHKDIVGHFQNWKNQGNSQADYCKDYANSYEEPNVHICSFFFNPLVIELI